MPKNTPNETPDHTIEPWSAWPLEKLLKEAAKALKINLTPNQISILLTYLEELLQWNRKINLIGPSSPQEAVIRHLADSLTPLPYLPDRPLKVLDLGSGGGLPGLAVKIIRPDWTVTLTESNLKKTSFLKHAIRLLALKDSKVLSVRVGGKTEDLALEEYDLITARALGSLSGFLALARPFLAPGGCILAYKGPKAAKEVEEAEETLSSLGLALVGTEEFKLPFLNHKRVLLFFEETV